MKKNRMKLRCDVFVLLLFLGLSLGSAFSEKILDLSFDNVLSKKEWIFIGSPQVSEGELVMDASNDRHDFESCSLVSRSPMERLNFSEHPIEITIKDIQISGDAPEGNRVFALVIANDKSDYTKSGSFVRFRLSADGYLQLAFQDIRTGKEAVQLLEVKKRYSLPIKSIVLRLSHESFKIEIEDQSGSQTKEGPLTGVFDEALWKYSNPYLTITGVRAQGQGTCIVKVGSIEIDSLR